MIHCNLSVLLAERRLTISSVAHSTGISRTTLTALAYNTSMGIQLHTLNTLCRYLDITPSQLLSFHPVDVVALSAKGTPERLRAGFMIYTRWSSKPCVLYGHIEQIEKDGKLWAVTIDLRGEVETEDSYPDFIKAVYDLPPAFRSDLELAIFREVMRSVFNRNIRIGAKIEIAYRVLWPELEPPQEKG